MLKVSKDLRDWLNSGEIRRSVANTSLYKVFYPARNCLEIMSTNDGCLSYSDTSPNKVIEWCYLIDKQTRRKISLCQGKVFDLFYE